ncbi:oxidase [Sulfolobales archaeon HS-7]|nr:oxidase [Sulfolobales archaeon HS-7]
MAEKIGLTDIINQLFQLKNDEWYKRVVMGMIVMALIWGVLGLIDSLMVRIQEAAWGTQATLLMTSQEYYAGIGLHAVRDLLGFAQQLEFAIFIFFLFWQTKVKARGKWVFNIGFIIFNISFMLQEGPIILYPKFNDNFFPATSWYYLSPIGLPGYSSYVASPLWFIGSLMVDIGTYIMGIWILYHFYLASKQMSQKLPIGLLFFLMDVLVYLMGYSGRTFSDIWDVLGYYNVVSINPIANQISWWIFGHSVVYMTWLPAVGALYVLVPLLSNKPLYSDRMGRISAILYLIFSNNVPIHHLYMVDLPVVLKIVEEIFTYAVVVPSMMTFFNLWATARGGKVEWNVITAWVVTAFAGAIGAGVTGIANGTISFDSIIHNTMWVVGHFHAMIFFSIVPAGFAILYLILPIITGRNWYSTKAAWVHFFGYTIGAGMIVYGFDQLGLDGIVRRSEIFPRTPENVIAEVVATAGAFLADGATLVWLLNVLASMVKGSPVNTEIGTVEQAVATVTYSLRWVPPLEGSPLMGTFKQDFQRIKRSMFSLIGSKRSRH